MSLYERLRIRGKKILSNEIKAFIQFLKLYEAVRNLCVEYLAPHGAVIQPHDLTHINVRSFSQYRKMVIL